MESRKQTDMKYPLRAAPPPPAIRKLPSSLSWQDELFANDPFVSNNPVQKKKPPPRPPPPRFTKPQIAKPDVPQRPAHFNRKPTILSSLINRKPKLPATESANNEFQSHVILPPPKNNQISNTPSLIDFSSPPSSPTLTTRSSSDGLSVDSFGSDITSSTANGLNNLNGGNTSQAESGFEDDFDLFSNTKSSSSNEMHDSWTGFDPFSPPKNAQKVNVTRPIYDSDFLDPLCNGKTVKSSVQTHKIPTIIRAKPARPKTPKNSALLTGSHINVKPLPLYVSGFSHPSPIEENYPEVSSVFDEGDYSPPMPSIPPPPPPPLLECSGEFSAEPASREWTPEVVASPIQPSFDSVTVTEEPYGIALYNFPGTHSDDLPFRVNDKIRLLRKLNAEWMYGKLRCGMEGMFPANFIQIVIPLPDVTEQPESSQTKKFVVTAMYDFVPEQDSDLGLTAGCKVNVLSKVNDSWLYGEIGNSRGQFPSNYVDHVPSELQVKHS